MRVRLAAFLAAGALCTGGLAAQTLESGYEWSVVAEGLFAADGVVLHPNGSLYICDERSSPSGGIWRIAPDGSISRLVGGMNRCDHLVLDWRSGELLVSEESFSGKVWRVDAATGQRSVEIPSTASRNTEGLAFDLDSMVLYLCEDRTPGRVQAWDGTDLTLVAGGFSRPEGLDVDIDGSVVAAITATDRVVRIDPATGAVSDLIPPGTLDQPDNVRFNPFTGEIFVDEDLPAGRIVRIAPDGSWAVFGSGFSFPQGMFFAPDGRLFLSEQGRNRLLVIKGFRPHLRGLAIRPVDSLGAFHLDGGPARAGLAYRILVTRRGSLPGTRLDRFQPGDRRRAPFNLDPALAGLALPGDRGRLDAAGAATFALRAPLRPGLAGSRFRMMAVILDGGRIDSFSSVLSLRLE